MLILRIVPIITGVAIALSACTTQNTPPITQRTSNLPVESTPTKQMPQTAQAPQTTQVVTDGRIRSAYAFPTGHKDSSTLYIERDLPSEIIANQEFTYEVRVTNVGHTPISAVTLRDDCASQLSLIRAEPAPVAQQAPFVWNLGDMKPDETRVVHVTGKIPAGNSFTSCASASFNSSLCLTAPIVEPALRVALHAPAQGTPCDTLPIKVVVSNTGTGMARNVQVAYPLPEGWTTADGKSTAQFAIAELPANESREFTLNAKAARVGDFVSKATATASPQIEASSMPVQTVIRQAVLAIKAEAPQSIYPNRNATVKFTVSNTGTGEATSPVIEAVMPAGAKFVSATEGGTLRGGNIVWNLQTIPVKGTRTLAMTVEPSAIGSFETIATAKAYCATPVRDSATVLVMGIPALLLEVTDLGDPVEIGSETVYEILITNQGSAPAHNVKIACMLENNEQYASAFGANARASGDSVVFDAIPTIAPKASVTLKLAVKCVAEGDTRFKVSMTADELQRPVEETESTHIYR